jgi:hypothetical protein
MRNGFPERAESSRVGIIIGIIYLIGLGTFTNVIAVRPSSTWFPLRACMVWKCIRRRFFSAIPETRANALWTARAGQPSRR